MKYAALMVLIVCMLTGSDAVSSTGGDFLVFRSATVQKFGLPEAQAIADAERTALHGICGMSVFKEKSGALWIFETKVGYAGLPAPDITVIQPASTAPSLLASPNEANQSSQPTPQKRRG